VILNVLTYLNRSRNLINNTSLGINKAVADGSVSNYHLVILQSLGNTNFFKRAVCNLKRAVQTNRSTDTQTYRGYKGLQVPPFNLTVNVETIITV